jgi:hemerythrin
MNTRHRPDPSTQLCDRDGGTVALDADTRRLEPTLAAFASFDPRPRWNQRPAMQRHRLIRVIASSAQESMLREINRQHRHIFALMHQYQTQAMKRAEGPAVLALLDRIVAAVAENFACEETVLGELDASRLARMRSIHRRTLGDLQASANDWHRADAANCLDPEHLVDALLVYYFVDDILVDL